jgi:hypothetical protein
MRLLEILSLRWSTANILYWNEIYPSSCHPIYDPNNMSGYIFGIIDVKVLGFFFSVERMIDCDET